MQVEGNYWSSCNQLTWMVDNRCAMTTHVRPMRASSSACCTTWRSIVQEKKEEDNRWLTMARRLLKGELSTAIDQRGRNTEASPLPGLDMYRRVVHVLSCCTCFHTVTVYIMLHIRRKPQPVNPLSDQSKIVLQYQTCFTNCLSI